MINQGSSLDVQSLRQSFDRSFAELPAATGRPTEQLLVIQVGRPRLALRLNEISGLHAHRAIVPIPSHNPALLGLVGFRGAPVPVFDLRLLLGYPGGPTPRWFALLSSSEPIALGFEAFVAHLQVTPDCVATDDSGRTQSQFLRGVVHSAGGIFPIIHCASLSEALIPRALSGPSIKEK